ncbi:MAG: trypsin-like peptidase domain-containing protein, partial [Planctomycetota bacterium]|nr:trypsin-like peptidase domain-containing protein [Planctomycetota bacterium]
GLVKLESEQSFPYAEMGDSAQLAKGQWVLAVGHPGGYESKRGAVVRLGRILAINKTGLRTDCALVGGDSGGPLFDMQGRVIGINSRIGDNLDKNIHVPVNTFGNTWDKLANAEMWGEFRQLFKPGFIGLSVDRDSDRAEISKISPGGPAEVAGLQVGDVILEFDGVKTDDYRSLVTIALQTPPDEEVVVRVRRGDKEMEFLLRTEER